MPKRYKKSAKTIIHLNILLVGGRKQMDNSYIWKNFSLGKELNVAGNFIFNGLKAFDSMESFYHEDEIFEFLYNISVGLERLGKIAVILIEHNNVKDQKEFEKSLITHNHQILLNKISKKHKCNLSSVHNEFIQLLSSFYTSMRYDRYSLVSLRSHDKERVSLVAFLEKHLKIKIVYKDFFVSPNEWRHKKFIGKIIGKICEVLYEIIQAEAISQNMYTYELRSHSKAGVIFQGKKYDFFDDNIVWKEILVYLMNTTDETGLLNFIRDIEPLNFDSALANEYISAFKSNLKRFEYIYEIEEHYLEIENKRERIEMLEIIGNRHVFFNEDIDEDIDEDINEDINEDIEHD